MTEPLLLSVQEAHRQLGLGRSKLYEFITAGDIETVKVGRRTLVPMESLQAFVEKLRHRPAVGAAPE
ncbi:helix-turn-helix domain-containing protein [Kineococcus sp. NBC_00420]|uniref:helix-turn-helix domain-containing protein n=1 Tax=Kineococcus sp. NBC_00420 TaxID=2903564 RepID=UPI002E1CDB97